MRKQRNGKYNAKKVIVDGIKFDSQAEAQYYSHLKSREFNGEIAGFKPQPEYTLQPSFVNPRGKKILPIKYKADFLVHYPDGTQEVIDVKGMETADFKLKKKMFEYKYDQSLILVCEAPQYLAPQEWIELDELKEIRKKRKKVTDKYGRKKSPEKEAELQAITDEYKKAKGETN
jgi:hypothetical protein